MKRLLHFATLGTYLVSYDQFASAREAEFSAPTATGLYRLKNTLSSLLSQLVDNYASLTSRIQVHGKGPRNIYNVQPWLVGGGVGEK